MVDRVLYLRQFAASDRGRDGFLEDLGQLEDKIAALEAQVLELSARVAAIGGFVPVGESFSDGTWFEDPDGRRFGWLPGAGADAPAEQQAAGDR